MAVLLLVLISPASAVAEDPVAKFMVSPAKLEFKAVPGQSENVVVQVVNQGTVPIHISVKTSDYTVSSEGAFTFTEPGHESYSASKWVSVDTTEFDLQVEEIREVTISLVAPTSAELGGHYAAVLFSSAGTAADGTGVQIVSQIGTLVLASVGDESDIVRSAEIVSYHVDADWLGRSSDHVVTLMNTGNVHVTARGEIMITDMSGTTVATVPLTDQTVLPGAERQYPAQWKTPLFGRFTATPKLEYGPDLMTFDTELNIEPVTFWIIPWHLIAAAIIVLLVGYWRVRQRRLRSRRSRTHTADRATQEAS